MRRRNIKNADEKIKVSNYIIKDVENHKKNLKKLFNNNHPLHIEIGMGKGQFILNMAKNNPNINFIGIEKYSSVLLSATKKALDYELENVYMLHYDANNLRDLFNDNEVERIYLNFSDPWPKSGHAKRRLSHSNFLEMYKDILTKNGGIWLKSDNRKYFEFSIMEIANFGFILKNVSLDLHNSDCDFNVETEYEEKFKQNGPIYRLEAYYETNNN